MCRCSLVGQVQATWNFDDCTRNTDIVSLLVVPNYWQYSLANKRLSFFLILFNIYLPLETNNFAGCSIRYLFFVFFIAFRYSGGGYFYTIISNADWFLSGKQINNFSFIYILLFPMLLGFLVENKSTTSTMPTTMALSCTTHLTSKNPNI